VCSLPDEVHKFKVVNASWNKSPYIKRKKALRLIEEHRAVFLSGDQIRLTDHPANRAAAKRSAQGYEMSRLTVEHVAHIPFVNPYKAL
jgi:hypothetical protein